MLKLDILYDPISKHLTIAPVLGHEKTRLWQESDKEAIAFILNGLAAEQPEMSDSLLVEIGERLGKRAAEKTGEPIEVHTGTGKVRLIAPPTLANATRKFLESGALS